MKIEKNYYSFLNWFLKQNDLCDQKNIKFMHNQRANSIHHESIKSVIYLPHIICVLSKIDLIKNLLSFIKFAIIDRKFKFKKLLMFVDEYFSWYMIHKNETKFETYEFIFSASKGVIRPIWTYTLPESKIFFFFYATHSEPKFLDEKPYKDGLWYLSTWEKIHFVDKTQHDEFTEKYNLKPLVFQKFSVPWMVDSESNIEIMEKCVALFDTLPVNREEIVTTFRETGIDVKNLAMAKEFVLAPLEIASELGLTVIHKFKRGNIEKAKKEYLEFIIELRKRFGKHYVLVDSNISPFRIINKSILVISKPYSTIGLIAKELAKKNIYFDSKNNIQNVDVPFSREIPIINNRLDLKAILERLA